MVEVKKETKYCKDCKHYKKPRCNLLDKFTARKTTCEKWEKR